MHVFERILGAAGPMVRTLRRCEAGGTMMVFALLTVPVVGLVGFSVDLTRSSNAKADIRSALDASLTSAALSGKDRFSEAAQTYFTSNTADLASHNPVAAFTITETSSSTIYRGTASAGVPTTFAALLGVNSIPLNMSASVTMPKASGEACIWVLDDNANHALTMNSGAEVTAPTCSIQVNSANKHAAAFNSGIDIDFAEICVVGEGVTNNYGPIEGLKTSCPARPDPFAATMPTVSPGSCDYSSKNYNGGNITLHPGTYCGHMNLNNETNVNFMPGLYVLNGSKWNANGGTWTGNGVTFYFADKQSGIQFNSAVTSSLTPPTSGDYAGIMMFEGPGLSKSNFVFNDSADFQIEGLIYLPSRNAIYNSNSVWRARQLTMVFNTLKLNQTTWTLTPGTNSDTHETDDGELRISS